MNTNEEQYEYCPRCDANLTLQKGYSNTVPFWICRGCGEMLINPDVDAEDDIAWICDKCGAMLNVQEGFVDNDGKWKCTCCGFENAIDAKNLYDTEEAYQADRLNPYKGLSDEEVLFVSSYKEENIIEDRPDVLLVSDEDGKKFIKKYLTVYDKSIYEYLKDNPVAHMPQILFVAEGDNCLVVIEEYVRGETVEELVQEERISKSQALSITREICSILDALHNQPSPIIHRDIKPSNVILTDEGEVFLLDMNAAKWYEPEKTDDTNYLGTMYYAAPEQAGYGMKASSTKTDVYAIGVLLNVMLTGAIPKVKQAPKPLWSIIEKCICLDPKDRYDVRELLHVLESISSEGNDNE